MKRIAVVCLFPLLAIVPMTALADEPALLVKMQLFRLLTTHITITGMTEVVSDPKAGYMLTQSGKIELDDKTIEMTPEMWRWNSAEIPFRIGIKIQPDDKLLLLSTPCLITQSGEDADMIVGCGPAEYFVPKGGGLYELKTTSSETEITCRVNPTLQADGKVLLYTKLGHNAILKREPLEGTYLDVGKPIFDTWEQSFKVTIEQDKDYCVLFSDHKNSLVVRLRVSDCKPEKIAEAQPEQPAESERK